MIISFAGFIGVGKSTYTEMLSNTLGYKPHYEPVDDNPILDLYYKDMKRYGFSLQIHFLNERFKIIQEALEEGNSIIDRQIEEDIIFTYVNMLEGNISIEEYHIYLDLLNNMMGVVRNQRIETNKRELMIYLRSDLNYSLDNIKKRGRDYEQIENNPELLEYYQLLHSQYDEWFDIYQEDYKLIIDASKYDIVNNPGDWEKAYKQIEEKIKRIERDTYGY